MAIWARGRGLALEYVLPGERRRDQGAGEPRLTQGRLTHERLSDMLLPDGQCHVNRRSTVIGAVTANIVEGRDSADAASAKGFGTLRDQHHALTRELILRAFVDRLETGELSEITIPDVAKAAGVSVRTVYRQFATRDHLLTAASEWIAEQYFADPTLPETIEEQLRQIELQPASWDEHPSLVRAIASTRVGQAVRSPRRARRLALISNALQELTSNLPESDQRRAEAIFGYLSNILAWVTMRDEHGLSGEEIGQALKWALETLGEDLRRRNEAAGNARKRAPRQRQTGRS